MVRTSAMQLTLVDPLLPITFLRKVAGVLQEYLVGSPDPAHLTEEVVCDHFDTVYELLEEMLDGEGNVLLTEVNTLKDIVAPPSWLHRLVKSVSLGPYVSVDPTYSALRTSRTCPLPRSCHGAAHTVSMLKTRSYST